MSKHRSANQFPSYQQQQPDMPQPEKPKKKHTGLKITAGIAAVLLIAAACTSTDDDEATSSASETTSAQPTDTLTTTGNTPEPDTTTTDDPEPETTTAPEPETDDTYMDDPDNAPDAMTDATATGHTLTFEAATSDGSTGSVTYVSEDFNIVQHADMAMPWTETIDGIDSKWDALGANMSVQQNGSGEVTCKMIWNGEVVSENTSTGPYSIATCSLPSNL